jgi:cytoskeletal protein CcmA (bactofilin family)
MCYVEGVNDMQDNLDDDDYDTILSADIDFKGELYFEKSFLIRGRLEGNIDAKGILLVDAGAEVVADVKADKVIIRGSVTGDITARRKVEITLSGKLRGNVHSPAIQMEAGCVFNGQCRMEQVES